MPVMARTGAPSILALVQAIQQVHGTGGGGGEADTETAGEFGISAGSESRGLLVPDMDVADPVRGLPEAFNQAIDAVPRQAEHGIDAPREQGVHDMIGYGVRHLAAPLVSTRAPFNRAGPGKFHSRRVDPIACPAGEAEETGLTSF